MLKESIMRMGIYNQNGYIKNSKYDGVVQNYYPSRELAREISLVNGELNGSMKSYYKSGGIKSEWNWKNRAPIGRYKEYLENGEVDPSNQQEQRVYNDKRAKSILRSLSISSELYAVRNSNKYPSEINDLTVKISPDSNKSILDNDYCKEGSEGFIYKCSFSEKGYKFIAEPIIIGESGTTTFTIISGGINAPLPTVR